jgi:hypothetical protein
LCTVLVEAEFVVDGLNFLNQVKTFRVSRRDCGRRSQWRHRYHPFNIPALASSGFLYI